MTFTVYTAEPGSKSKKPCLLASWAASEYAVQDEPGLDVDSSYQVIHRCRPGKRYARRNLHPGRAASPYRRRNLGVDLRVRTHVVWICLRQRQCPLQRVPNHNCGTDTHNARPWSEAVGFVGSHRVRWASTPARMFLLWR